MESVHVDSMWIPYGVHAESMWSPCGVLWGPPHIQPKKRNYVDSMWSPHGVLWSLCGVVESTRNLWGRVKYTVTRVKHYPHRHLIDFTLNRPKTQMPWTSIICPPITDQTQWRKASASNAESLDTEHVIHSFIQSSNEEATCRFNDHNRRRWKAKNFTRMSDPS